MEDESVASRSLAPAAPESAPQEKVWLVRLGEKPVVLPPGCASCGAPAAREARLADGRSHELLVGYCDACVLSREGEVTRRIAIALAAVIVSACLAAALPIVLPWQPTLVVVGLTLAGGLLPWGLGSLLARRRRGSTPPRFAVWFRAPAELVCRRYDFASEVAVRAGSTPEAVAAPRRRPPFELLLIVGVAAVGAPLSHAFHHPLVRVLDLTTRPFEFLVDGHRLGRVEPSSSESPLAGRDLRVPAGERELAAIDVDGVTVASSRVDVHAGEHHLYAPGAPEVCFWLETVGYGRERERSDSTALAGDARFWVIPAHVNGWFMPAAPAADGSQVSGGRTTVLRQGPCDEAPPTR